jgi:TatD DNase family protein
VVTYKKADMLQDVAARAPLKRLLLETDCPFLTPVPFRGAQNEPAYVAHVAKKVAELRSIPVEEVARATTENARRIFGLGE